MLCFKRNAHNAQHVGEWAALEAHLPGLASKKVGILLVSEHCLYTRFRPHWWYGVVDEEEAEIWNELSEDLAHRARETGAAKLLDWLENTASHAIRISPRTKIRFAHAEITLNNLYRDHVESFATTLEPTEPEPARKRSLQLPNWLTKSTILNTGISAALAVALLVAVQFPLHKSPVAKVNLTTYRDAETETIPEKRPVHITLGPVNLPDGPVGAEIINDVGSKVWRGNTSVSRQYAQISLSRIEDPGIHLLRLYSTSHRDKEVLAEVRFLVANENGSNN